jgi:hypothetical protein
VDLDDRAQCERLVHPGHVEQRRVGERDRVISTLETLLIA